MSVIENPSLKAKGAKWYHTSDYHAPTMSRASLGRFMYSVLKVGAQIGEIWAFNPKYDRSPVYFTLFMTEEMKTQLESEFGGKIQFRDPPRIVLA